MAAVTQTEYPTREQILAKYKERLNVAPADQKLSRRRFLSVVTLGWTVFTVAMTTGFLALFRALVPNVDFTKVLRVKIGPPDNYAPDSVDATFKDKKFWVVRDCEKIVAVRAVCTHLGCTPNWMESDNKFKCPCHGSGFRGPKGCYQLTGMNFEGPAPTPLLRFKITMGDDGNLLVDESQMYAYEKGEWSNPESFYPV